MNYRSNGKLMLTGEYLALDNALVLALPTKFGQSLEVIKTKGNGDIAWISYTNKKQVWFQNTFEYKNNKYIPKYNNYKEISNVLLKIINKAIYINPKALDKLYNYNVTTTLEFPQNWGLGSSSTLINNIAQWFNINPFKLYFNVFNGSGYDIAAANNNKPITYYRNNNSPIIKTIEYLPKFSENIYFIHLNEKQNSYKEVKKYNKNKENINIEEEIIKITKITQDIISTQSLLEFENLLEKHEEIISNILGMPTIKSKLFKDYNNGVVKSLGAWGGDFILVTGNNNSIKYFMEKGYNTIFSYNEIIL